MRDIYSSFTSLEIHQDPEEGVLILHRAIANLQRFCDLKLPNRHEIVIIDVLKQPQIAELEKILITPTLVKEQPPPTERIIGDLSNTEIVLFALNIETQHLENHSS